MTESLRHRNISQITDLRWSAYEQFSFLYS